MIAVITGDIINSRTLPDTWIDKLKYALNHLKGHNVKWEIFRGDSFQIELNVEDALLNAVYIKACIKTIKKADVRIGIGIGQKSTNADRVGEANGEAFINSGMAFDALKANKVNLSIKTPWLQFDEEINLMIKLGLIAMDNWGQTSAEMVQHAIENQDVPQQHLAKISGRSQSSVSEALKRARYSELMELEKRYKVQISKLIEK